MSASGEGFGCRRGTAAQSQSGYSLAKEIGRQQDSHTLCCAAHRGRPKTNAAPFWLCRHCKGRSDEAISCPAAALPSGARLLRFARNDKVAAINAIGEDND